MSLAMNADVVSSHRYPASSLRSKRNILRAIADEFDALYEGLGGHGQGTSRADEVSGLDAQTLRTRFFAPKTRDVDGDWLWAPIPAELNRL